MPSPHCFATFQTCLMRVAKLDAAGHPLEGVNNGYVTDAVIDVGISLVIDDPDEKQKKNGCGTIRHRAKDCKKITGVELEMNLCDLDSELVSFLTGGSVIRDLAGAGVGNAIGYEIPGIADACPNGVSVEAWTKAWDGSAQATPPFLGGSTVAYFLHVFPKVKWTHGDTTLEDDISDVPMVGDGSENTGLTIDGPFNDWNADVAARGGITKAWGWFLTGTIPTAACGSITVPTAPS